MGTGKTINKGLIFFLFIGLLLIAWQGIALGDGEFFPPENVSTTFVPGHWVPAGIYDPTRIVFTWTAPETSDLEGFILYEVSDPSVITNGDPHEDADGIYPLGNVTSFNIIPSNKYYYLTAVSTEGEESDFIPVPGLPVHTGFDWYVDNNAPAGGIGSEESPLNSVQAAIDGIALFLSPGMPATIHVASSEQPYEEKLLISGLSNITLLGESRENVVLSAPYSPLDENPVIKIVSSENIHIKDFTVTGGFDAVHIEGGSYNTIENLFVHDVPYAGIRISNEAKKCRVWHNHISNTGSPGIILGNPSVPSRDDPTADVSIFNNTISSEYGGITITKSSSTSDPSYPAEVRENIVYKFDLQNPIYVDPSATGYTVTENILKHTGPDWYVNDDAVANGDGSLESPFQTIQEAIEAIIALENRTERHLIHIFPGNYIHSQNVITAINNIRIHAYDDGSGGDILVDASSGQNAFAFSGDNITIGEMTIKNAQSSGIYLSGENSIAIGLHIENCQTGISFNSVDNGNITNSFLSNNTTGISLVETTNSLFEYNVIQAPDDSSEYFGWEGINFSNSSNNTFRLSTIVATKPIYLTNSNNNVIRNNVIRAIPGEVGGTIVNSNGSTGTTVEFNNIHGILWYDRFFPDQPYTVFYGLIQNQDGSSFSSLKFNYYTYDCFFSPSPLGELPENIFDLSSTYIQELAPAMMGLDQDLWVPFSADASAVDASNPGMLDLVYDYYEGPEWYVDPSTPINGIGSLSSPFNGIPSALEAAQYMHQIRLLPGQYFIWEPIIIQEHSITLTGWDPDLNQPANPEEVIVQPHPMNTNSGSVIIVESDNVTIQNLVATGAGTNMFARDHGASGLLIRPVNNARITDVKTQNNEQYGIEVVQVNGVYEIERCVVSRNARGGILCRDTSLGSNIKLIENNISENPGSNYEFGLFLKGQGHAAEIEIRGNKIFNQEYGLRLSSVAGNVYVSHNEIRDIGGCAVRISDQTSDGVHILQNDFQDITSTGILVESGNHVDEVRYNNFSMTDDSDLFFSVDENASIGDASTNYYLTSLGEIGTKITGIDPLDLFPISLTKIDITRPVEDQELVLASNLYLPDWYVNDNAPAGGDGSANAPFNTIQTAINAASEGDIISILPGTYNEGLVIQGASKNNLTLFGDFFDNDAVKIIGPGLSSPNYTLHLKDVSGVTIEHLSVTNGYQGLRVESSSDCILSSINSYENGNFNALSYNSENIRFEHCSFNNSNFGLSLYQTHNNIVENCSAEGNVYFGFLVNQGSTGNVLQQNTAEYNGHAGGIGFSIRGNETRDNILSQNASRFNVCGIEIDSEAHNNALIRNTVENNGRQDLSGNMNSTSPQHGVRLINAHNNILIGNTISENNSTGIYITAGSSANTITDYDADYIQFLDSLSSPNIVSENLWIGIMIEAGSKSNIVESNIIPNNLNRGIYLRNLNLESFDEANIIQENQIFNNNGRGIDLYASTYQKVLNNTCYDHPYEGILLQSNSSHNLIQENTVTKNGGSGVALRGGSSHNELRENRSLYNTRGLELFASSENALIQNIVLGNGNPAYESSDAAFTPPDNYLYPLSPQNGIMLDNSHHNTMIGNVVEGNSATGFYIVNGSSYNTIQDYDATYVGDPVANTVKNNAWCGIRFENSPDNNVLGNVISSNGMYGLSIKNCANLDEVMLVEKNMIAHNGCYGLPISNSQNVSITQNTIIHNGHAPDAYSFNDNVYLAADCNNISIKHNNIYDAGGYNIHCLNSSSVIDASENWFNSSRLSDVGASINTLLAEQWQPIWSYGAIDIFKAIPEISSGTSDPGFPNQWYLHNTGQTLSNGTVCSPDLDIDAPEAWQYEMGRAEIVINILNDQVVYTYPDLVNKLWFNSEEFKGNTVDDDANGYVDDYYNQNNDLSASLHELSCGLIAGAQRDNGIGISGVAPGSRIMSAHRDYALAQGVKIFSNSVQPIGGHQTVTSSPIYQAGGVLFSGASYWDAQGNRVGLAANIINPNGQTIEFDNPIDDPLNMNQPVVCGGSQMWLPENHTANAPYVFTSGHSYAIPVLAGIAGLMYSYYPEELLTPEFVYETIMLACEDVESTGYGIDSRTGFGMANAAHVLKVFDGQILTGFNISLSKNQGPSYHMTVEALDENGQPVTAMTYAKLEFSNTEHFVSSSTANVIGPFENGVWDGDILLSGFSEGDEIRVIFADIITAEEIPGTSYDIEIIDPLNIAINIDGVSTRNISSNMVLNLSLSWSLAEDAFGVNLYQTDSLEAGADLGSPIATFSSNQTQHLRQISLPWDNDSYYLVLKADYGSGVESEGILVFLDVPSLEWPTAFSEANIYVDPSYDETNGISDGTVDHPYKSITSAYDAVPISTPEAPTVTNIFLASGDYHMNASAVEVIAIAKPYVRLTAWTPENGLPALYDYSFQVLQPFRMDHLHLEGNTANKDALGVPWQVLALDADVKIEDCEFKDHGVGRIKSFSLTCVSNSMIGAWRSNNFEFNNNTCEAVMEITPTPSVVSSIVHLTETKSAVFLGNDFSYDVDYHTGFEYMACLDFTGIVDPNSITFNQNTVTILNGGRVSWAHQFSAVTEMVGNTFTKEQPPVPATDPFFFQRDYADFSHLTFENNTLNGFRTYEVFPVSDFYVDADAPAGGDGSEAAPFQMIEHAVACVFVDNTMIHVAEGTYPLTTSPLNIASTSDDLTISNLTIQGVLDENEAPLSKIIGSLRIDKINNFTLDGFEIENGGVELFHSSYAHITRNKFTGLNTTARGTNILLTGSNNCTFDYNFFGSAANYSVLIQTPSTAGSSNNVFHHNLFTHNTVSPMKLFIYVEEMSVFFASPSHHNYFHHCDFVESQAGFLEGYPIKVYEDYQLVGTIPSYKNAVLYEEQSFYPQGIGLYVSLSDCYFKRADDPSYTALNDWICSDYPYNSLTTLPPRVTISSYQSEPVSGVTASGIVIQQSENQTLRIPKREYAFESDDLIVTFTLSEEDSMKVSKVILNENAEADLSEMGVSSLDENAVEKITLENLWNVAFLNASGEVVELDDPVTVTVKENAELMMSTQNEEEVEPTLNVMSVLCAKDLEGNMMTAALYDEESKTLTATIDDVSIIALGFKTQALAANLQSLVIYPNPFRLETNASGDQRMKLDNLTADAHIEIYNVLGEMVLEAQITNNASASNSPHVTPVAGNPGRVAWDLKNAGGQRVASGVYVVVVSNSAGERVIKKVSVIW